MASIMELEDTVRGLPQQESDLFYDIFRVSASTGELIIPDTLMERAVEYFRNPGEKRESVIKRLREQKVVRTYNLWTRKGAMFNQLRAGRPGMKPEEIEQEMARVREHIRDALEGCDFCQARSLTPEDVFPGGRVEGRHCVTGSNIAKYDAWNGMVYFDEHDPLEFGEDELSDYLETVFKWFKKVHEYDEDFRYPFFGWNCLEKAGASRVHGHSHVLMSKGMPYAKVLALRAASQQYRGVKGRDYFGDLFDVHGSLGLAIRHGNAGVFVYITPVKEKETLIVAPFAGYEDVDSREDLRMSLYRTLRCFIDKLGVHSFNVSISMPPITDSDHDFPYVARVVDRGSIFKKTADIGVMELYGENVIATDPYRVMEALETCFCPAPLECT